MWVNYLYTCFKSYHVLIMLMSLEFMFLDLFGYLMKFLMTYDFEMYFCMIFMVMSDCEGSLSWSILVMLIRTHGNDFLHSFNLMW